MRKKEYSLRAIAGALDRAVSTISDELRRNEVSGRYDPRKADHKASIRRREAKYQGMTIVQDAKLRDFIERLLGIRIYFCHPYHAWEKGTVENTNRYIRRYVPKRSDISKYAPRTIRAVEARLNRRIMATLSYRTPQEVMERLRTRKKRLRAGKESQK